MGMVLAAGAGPALAAVWGRQLLAREAARGAPAGAGGTGAAQLPDPVGAAVAAVAGARDRPAAALLLDDARAWQVLLARPWPGGTDALGHGHRPGRRRRPGRPGRRRAAARAG